MATKASGTILNGCRILEAMAAHPRDERTVASLAAETELTPAQVEGALLAFVEAGFVQARTVDGRATYYLLGIAHLQLALAELSGLMEDASHLAGILHRLDRLPLLESVLHAVGRTGTGGRR